ncbi:hypothetical protein BDZ94DRAFT_733852 [Collybia nuda]|uniref:Uncharacterized protein n=1 Tax=Collybia nuda TaxID=64659 RepID=A0A9P5Y4T4_9AGAR|nr:hypothetical protein BDZ94DRAFT_733852 [Collybia nuda]
MVISLVLLLGLLVYVSWYRRKFGKRERNLEAQYDLRRHANKILSPEVATTSYSVATVGSYPSVVPSQPFILASAPSERSFQPHENTTGGPVIMSYNPDIPQQTNSESNHSITSASNTNSSHPSKCITNSTSPRVNRAPLRKGVTELPVTAGQFLEAVSENELRSNRRIVKGRPQDFGSSSGLPPSATSGSQELGGLPPDYDQAIEPYHPK